jgi:hypothetical protein
MRILDLGGLGLRCGARRPPSQWVDWRWTAAIHPDLFAHRPIFVCFVSVKTFSVAFEALICSLLFSNCSATSGLIFQLSRQRFSKGSRLRPCSSDSITYDGTRFRALDLLFGNTCSPTAPQFFSTFANVPTFLATIVIRLPGRDSRTRTATRDILCSRKNSPAGRNTSREREPASFRRSPEAILVDFQRRSTNCLRQIHIACEETLERFHFPPAD